MDQRRILYLPTLHWKPEDNQPDNRDDAQHYLRMLASSNWDDFEN